MIESLFLLGFFSLIGIAILAFWFCSLMHSIKNPRLSDYNRLIGIVLIVILNLIGSCVYLLLQMEGPAQRRSFCEQIEISVIFFPGFSRML